MPKCAVKKGFFVLRDCGEKADITCEECARPVCREHHTTRGGQRLCLDCEGRRGQHEQGLTDVEDHAYPYNYRRGYFGHGHYSPIYWGMTHDRYYDDYDVRAFNEDAVEVDDWGADEDADGDFFDS